MDMATWLENIAHSKDGWLILMLTILLSAQTIDFVLGVSISILNKKQEFSSSKLKLGLLVKVLQLALVIFVLVPLGISLGDFGSLGVRAMLLGFIISELYSILGHLKFVNDDSHWIENLEQFIKNITNK